MEFSYFHLSEIRWLYGLVIIPILALTYIFFYHKQVDIKLLRNLIDLHLIEHVLKNCRSTTRSLLKSVIVASILWILIICAMAGPRWDFTEIKSYKHDNILLILLDLSKSMDASDLSPSRLTIARQKIEDIITADSSIRVGLVAFAADAHIVSPITDNIDNIKHLLPILGTDLMYIQGTRLTPALKTAQQMLSSETSSNKSILMLSDGGFVDQGWIEIVQNLAKKGIVIHIIGVGTEKGVNISGPDGKYIERNGKIITSVLEKQKLQQLSGLSNGQYFDLNNTSDCTKAILTQIYSKDKLKQTDENSYGLKQWKERFYIFVLPFMLIILPWFRRGFYFPVILVCILSYHSQTTAVTLNEELFLSKEQQGLRELENHQDYDKAVELFNDPYNKGVAYYKAGKYAEAEKFFRQSNMSEVKVSALYNLGNALAKQHKFDEAVDVYKQVLKEQPNHDKARHNIGIVKKLLVQISDQEKKKPKKKTPEDPNNKFPGGGGGGGGGSGDDKNDNEQNKKKGDGGKNNDKDSGDKDKGHKDSSNDNQGNNDNKQDKNNSDLNNGNNSKQSNGTGKIDAEQWLNQIPDNSKEFLKNQFYLDSQKQNTGSQQVLDPW